MSMSYLHSIPTYRLLTHPLRALQDTLAAWQARRRRESDLSELASLDPRLLEDIGLRRTEQSGRSPTLLELHPAAVAICRIGAAAGRGEEGTGKQPEG
jgi:uncharacterized protein YjiS (DUF1127 family)